MLRCGHRLKFFRRGPCPTKGLRSGVSRTLRWSTWEAQPFILGTILHDSEILGALFIPRSRGSGGSSESGGSRGSGTGDLEIQTLAHVHHQSDPNSSSSSRIREFATALADALRCCAQSFHSLISYRIFHTFISWGGKAQGGCKVGAMDEIGTAREFSRCDAAQPCSSAGQKCRSASRRILSLSSDII